MNDKDNDCEQRCAVIGLNWDAGDKPYKSLGPANLCQSLGCNPYPPHVCDLAFFVHPHEIYIFWICLLLGRLDRSTFINMSAPKCGKKYCRTIDFVKSRTVQFVGTNIKRPPSEYRHPFALFFNRPDIYKRFALGGKSRAVRHVAFAPLPTRQWPTSMEYSSWLFQILTFDFYLVFFVFNFDWSPGD